MRPLNALEVVKVLKKHGFALSRQRGSHMIFKNVETGIIVPVPFHGRSKPIPRGTLDAIIKQSKISKKEFD